MIGEQPLIGWKEIDEFLAPIVRLSTWTIQTRHKHLMQCRAVFRVRRGVGKSGRAHEIRVMSFPSMLIRYLQLHGDKF